MVMVLRWSRIISAVIKWLILVTAINVYMAGKILESIWLIVVCMFIELVLKDEDDHTITKSSDDNRLSKRFFD